MVTGKVVMALALVLAGASQAKAEILARDYPVMKGNPVFRAYVEGIGDGLSWANVALMGTKRRPLYCQPANLVLGEENYAEILDRELTQFGKTYTLESSVGLILLNGLQRTFPCKP